MNKDDDVQATGWFQASDFEGTKSPSAQRRSSSHQGVRKPSLSATLSTSWTHLADRLAIRAVIQSRVRTARWSSSSRQATSTSFKAENRSAKAGCGIDTRAVVRVVTGIIFGQKEKEEEKKYIYIYIYCTLGKRRERLQYMM